MQPKRGEQHPRAKLTNHEVEHMRRLREETHPPPPLSLLAVMFEISKTQVFRICCYQER
jgi:hypothetical protein